MGEIIVNCPYCTAPLMKIRDDINTIISGMHIKCPHCRRAITVITRREVVIFCDNMRQKRSIVEKNNQPNIRKL